MECALCGKENTLKFELSKDMIVYLCDTCKTQVENKDYNEEYLMPLLNNSMWSEDSATKVLSYIILKDLGRNDLVDMMYLTDEELNVVNSQKIVLDANNNVLKNGDNVSVIKDLDVKGTSKTIKRGTIIKNIKMCDVEDHISCKVDGIGQVFLKTEFLKKI